MTSAKSNIYWGEGVQGKRLKKCFLDLALLLELGGESELARYIAANADVIDALLTKGYNGVDLEAITRFIDATEDYNSVELQDLISNKCTLNALLNVKTIDSEFLLFN